ncbi:MAG: hypothetical protein IT463_08970 [Planctomycetes bacterium]|nr:hypothetical protein [Planctomycetota bacterium]
MSTRNLTRSINGLQAALRVLHGAATRLPLQVLEYDSTGLAQHGPDLLLSYASRTPTVALVRPAATPAGLPAGLDIQQIRWVVAGGYPPILLVPATLQQCAEFAARAVNLACRHGAPVVLLIEAELLAEEVEDMALPAAEAAAPVVQSIPALDQLSPAENTALNLQARLAGLSPEDTLFLLDEWAGPGRAEWLVVSYGLANRAAASAVTAARGAGQRVTHLALGSIWPLPESLLLRVAAGARHVVTAERNLGQLALELRRLLPDRTISPVGRVTEPPPAAAILEALQRTPRCC